MDDDPEVPSGIDSGCSISSRAMQRSSANGDSPSPVDIQQIVPLPPTQTRFGFEPTAMLHLGNLQRDTLGSIGCP
jgi:hypothetical protein